jgi:hypothetical protein
MIIRYFTATLATLTVQCGCLQLCAYVLTIALDSSIENVCMKECVLVAEGICFR